MGWDEHEAGADFDPEGFSASVMFSTSDAERRPVEELYGVFTRPRDDRDLQAGELAARYGALDMGAVGFPAGAVREDEGRVLLQGLGGDWDTLYAAPTTNGYIAYALLPNGGGGCSVPGPDGLLLNITYHSESLVVYGVVGDDIASVEVVYGGETSPAVMGENGFGYRFRSAQPDELEAVVLHRHDGTTSHVPIGLGDA